MNLAGPAKGLQVVPRPFWTLSFGGERGCEGGGGGDIMKKQTILVG